MGRNKGLIIDAHTHFMGPLYPMTKEEREIKWGAKEMLLHMDECGVNMAAVSSIEPFKWISWKKYPLGGNEEVAEALRKHPNRIIGLFVPNVYGSMDIVTRQVEEAVKKYNFKGLKIHPWAQDVSPNHPMLYPIYEKAAKLRVPVQFHSGTAPYCTPLQVAEVARTFPEVPVIMGHMGKQDLWLDVIPAARLSENIYVDTSGQCIRALIEKFAAEIGADRILFASDWPGLHMDVEIQRILDCDINEEEKRLILGENAAKIFNIKT